MIQPCSKFGDASQYGTKVERIGPGSVSWVRYAGHVDVKASEEELLFEYRRNQVKSWLTKLRNLKCSDCGHYRDFLQEVLSREE